MSQPTFPENPNITRDDAVNQILSSVAMEELGLSHILNAEGEKIQYAIGTIPGVTGPEATIEDVLNVNDSVQNTLLAAASNQVLLNQKMKTALNSATMQGPTGAAGATGATGPAGGLTLNFFNPANAGGYLQGDVIWYNGNVYVVNKNNPTGTPGSSPDYSMLNNPATIPFTEVQLTQLKLNVTSPAPAIMLSPNPYTIPFDTVTAASTLNLGYTAANNGVFTLQPGSYAVSYWVDMNNVNNPNIRVSTVELDVLVNNAVYSSTQVSYSGTSMGASQLSSGSTLVNVTSPNTTLSVTFPVQTNAIIEFSAGPRQGAIVIVKLA